MQPTFVYNATVKTVHDGDTMTVIVDLGFKASLEVILRLNGINAPELSATDGSGTAAKYHLQLLLAGTSLTTAGVPCVIKTYKNPGDKYGRWLADVISSTGVDINQQMVTDGFALPYSGTGPKPTP